MLNIEVSVLTNITIKLRTILHRKILKANSFSLYKAFKLFLSIIRNILLT